MKQGSLRKTIPEVSSKFRPDGPYPGFYGSPQRALSNEVSPNTASSVSTGGTKRLKDDPVREVLTQFLDIYQTDQERLKVRYCNSGKSR